MIWNLSALMSNPTQTLIQLAYTIVIVLISLTLHEWAHAAVAYRCGDPTAKNLGRMTLNPLAHIDWIGFLCMLLVGFGWAKPVPVNSNNFRHYKRDEAFVSLAGIVMNFLLVLLSMGILVLIGRLQPAWLSNSVLVSVLLYTMSINICLMVFNLLPIFPLDGYHIFELIFARVLPMRVFVFLRRYGQFLLIALLLVFRFVGTSPLAYIQQLFYQLTLYLIVV